MESSGSSGFDMSKMSMAEKLLAGGSILLLIDSFLPWQRFCIDLGGLEDIVGGGGGCASLSMWSGSGSFAGIIAGLLAIALVILGVLSMTGSMANMNMGTMSVDKLVAFLGLGVAGFGLLKFIFALTESPGWAAFVGLVLLLAIGYGAWQKLQASGGMSTGGSGTMGGGTMGGGTTPPSTPPPSTPPPGGGVPPSGSSDM